MSAPATDRPLRRDAARNLERVLAAAREVFGERGLDAPVEDVAARAGVGTGTVYRRFPTKEALIRALVDAMIADLLALGERALAAPDGAGVETFLRGMGELFTASPACLDRLWRGGFAEPQREQLRALLRQLVGRDRAAGTLRPEITAADVSTLVWGVHHLISTTVQVAPNAWRRYLDIQLAGISAVPRPIGHRPLTQAELSAVIERY